MNPQWVWRRCWLRRYSRSFIASTEKKVSPSFWRSRNALMALSIVQYAYVMEGGRIVSQNSAEEMSRDDSVRRFYLGMADHEEHQSYRKILEEKRAAAGVRNFHERQSRGGSDDS